MQNFERKEIIVSIWTNHMRQKQGNTFSCDGCLVECRRGRGSSGRLLRREVQRRREALRQPEVGTALRLRGRRDGGKVSQSLSDLRSDFSPGECLAERRFGVLWREHTLCHLLQVVRWSDQIVPRKSSWLLFSGKSLESLAFAMLVDQGHIKFTDRSCL